MIDIYIYTYSYERREYLHALGGSCGSANYGSNSRLFQRGGNYVEIAESNVYNGELILRSRYLGQFNMNNDITLFITINMLVKKEDKWLRLYSSARGNAKGKR